IPERADEGNLAGRIEAGIGPRGHLAVEGNQPVVGDVEGRESLAIEREAAGYRDLDRGVVVVVQPGGEHAARRPLVGQGCAEVDVQAGNVVGAVLAAAGRRERSRASVPQAHGNVRYIRRRAGRVVVEHRVVDRIWDVFALRHTDELHGRAVGP